MFVSRPEGREASHEGDASPGRKHTLRHAGLPMSIGTTYCIHESPMLFVSSTLARMLQMREQCYNYGVENGEQNNSI